MRVLRRVEGYQWTHGQFDRVADDEAVPGEEGTALARAAAQLSRDLRVRALVVPARSGRTVHVVSSQRPAAPVYRRPPTTRRCAGVTRSCGEYTRRS